MKTQRWCLWVLVLCGGLCDVGWAQPMQTRFQQRLLSEAFHSEGACFADIDGDGQQDVVSGPYWYRGPEFRQRHAYTAGAPLSIRGYSPFFFTFAFDFNNDDHSDVLAIGMPGQPAYWFENPGSVGPLWKKHLALEGVGNESPLFADIDGDGRPELICLVAGNFGYAKPDPTDHRLPWRFTKITADRNYGAFTHGMGIGDVNGDGRMDLLETHGWWEQTERRGQPFQFHPQRFAAAGGSQMFALDIDGDQDMDVLSVQNAHGYGLTWFEQRGAGEANLFVPHPILTDDVADHPEGVSISQMHSLAVADVDGDGVQDVVTGKRYYAHGGGDPGAHALPVLYWFRTERTPAGPKFVPHLIAKRAGVGTQLTTGDVNADGKLDVLVGNKLGTSLFLQADHAAGSAKRPQLTESDRRIGTNAFANVIRETDPLTPEEERETFVLPPGFEVQLVAAEPQIAKPMNMAFDARGRLWVSSSVEYPFAAPEGKGRDTIKILEDTNGDGRADRVTTFADGLNIPMGLYPYQDGVICFSIPHIWFLRDTDGDGRADQRHKLYGPMGYDRDTHGMCNAFRRGPDGWLYACHGFNNHTTVSGTDGHQVEMQSGNTFRMRLDGSRIEHYTHGQVNPFGMTFDRWGDLFSADCHTKPITLLVQDGYYESFGKPHDGLGFVPKVMEHLHGSTAIGGIAFAPSQFPDAYRGDTFHGNVMTSRINRNSLQRTGASISAREEPDLLISGDPWFRPSDLVLGPDDALYVADFYNKIIGHYEVKLDDPRRDRLRGRIWRIVYRGSDESSEDTRQGIRKSPPLNTLDEQLRALGASNQTLRTLAREALIARGSVNAPQRPAVLRGLDAASNDRARVDRRIESLWALHRLGAVDTARLTRALDDGEPRVRTHGLRIVADQLRSGGVSVADGKRLIAAGLEDDAPMVRRAAALAAAQRNGCVEPTALLQCYAATATSDVHLRHVLLMALRRQLAGEGTLTRLAETTQKAAEIQLLARVAMALKTPEGGRFIAGHAQHLTQLPREEFTEYLTVASRFVQGEDVGQLIQVVRTHFAQDMGFQMQMLEAMYSGLRQQDTARPRVLNAWARDLALAALDFADQARSSLPWSYFPVPGLPTSEQAWVVSNQRNSADGEKKSTLWSSFPRGEQRTGIARSAPFRLGQRFGFYLAGHDGFPDKPLGKKNLIQVRDHATLKILQQWSPPRNDEAQRRDWETGELAGSQVFVELIDADPANAYAWFAVGRFTEEGLNPSASVKNRVAALALIGRFQLQELRPRLAALLNKAKVSPTSRLAAARALAGFEGSATQRALAETFTIANLPSDLRHAAATALTQEMPQGTIKTIGGVMKLTTSERQQRIGATLASDASGMQGLVELWETGAASLQLLRDPSITQKLDALADDKLLARVKRLRQQLPTEDPRTEQAIKTRLAAYQRAPGTAAMGVQVFAKHCAACHQIAGKGKSVGPNLDGVGNRGLQRLAEDMLAPSRNVDVAFMSTAIITEDGQVLSGIVKPKEGNQVLLIDRKGQELRIDKEDIVERKQSRLSPMPANFAESLTAEEFRHLVAYLLSLRS